MNNDRKYSCVNCGNHVKNLYKKYNSSILKLTNCENCYKITDKYIEYDTVIVIIDLVLLRKEAYRHILYNTEFKNFWKLSVILLLMESYSEWILNYCSQNGRNTEPYLREVDVDIADFQFYLICLQIAIKTACFIMVLYILTYLYCGYVKIPKISLLLLWKTLTISSFGVFLLLPSLIWDISFQYNHLSIVALYLTLSQLFAYTVLCGDCSKFWSIFAIFSANYCKSYLFDFIDIVSYADKKNVIMAKNVFESSYMKGYWIWDDNNNGLEFIDTSPKIIAEIVVKDSPIGAIENKIRFIDNFDDLLQTHFRIHYQRKITNQLNIITLQDIKDVAIFTANAHDLSSELIDLLHTKQIDAFLRSLLIYFQYYFQILEYFHIRSNISKLSHSVTRKFEDTIRDNLSELRTILAKNYSAIILGLDDMQRFHHIRPGTKISLSDKDRKLFEGLFCMTVRIIWIGLNRQNLVVIEFELNRLLRTNLFNANFRTNTGFQITPLENRVISGLANTAEVKLKHRSPLIQEILFGNHDKQLSSQRLEYLKVAFTAPEEILYEKGIGIGILGQDRQYYEPFLRLEEAFINKVELNQFNLPEENDDVMFDSKELSCKYIESDENRLVRIQQCRMWKKYLQDIVTIF